MFDSNSTRGNSRGEFEAWWKAVSRKSGAPVSPTALREFQHQYGLAMAAWSTAWSIVWLARDFEITALRTEMECLAKSCRAAAGERSDEARTMKDATLHARDVLGPNEPLNAKEQT